MSLSNFLLFMYRNASDFCVWILYSVTLLNLLMSSSCFLIVSLDIYLIYIFLYIVSCHLQMVRVSLLFQSAFLLFFFFSDCYS